MLSFSLLVVVYCFCTFVVDAKGTILLVCSLTLLRSCNMVRDRRCATIRRGDADRVRDDADYEDGCGGEAFWAGA